MTIAAIVLAAGKSSRFPNNKLLAPFHGRPMVCHAVEAALTGGARPVVVVAGSHRQALRLALAGYDIAIAENRDYKMGLSTSLICGLRSLPASSQAAIVLLGDMPLVSPKTVAALIAGHAPASGRSIVVPVFHGRRGNPVLWDRQLFAAMETMIGDIGAKHLMVLHQELVYGVEVDDDGVLIDIDTIDDLQAHAR